MRNQQNLLWQIFAITILAVPSLWGQSATTGALTGTIANPTAELIPGVSVTLLNSATNQTLTTVTDGGGTFGFSLLAPGTYQVSFRREAYRPSHLQSIVINVSETASLQVTLEPGNVSGEAALCICKLNTAVSSSSGTLVDNKTITTVPLTTRNFTQVMSMASGSAADVNNAGILGAGSQTVAVNGNSGGGTYTIDGAASGSTVPNPDTISEFKIQTSQYDAGYGAKVPNTNLITLSGQNDLHGTLFEFLRNDIFNANAYFRNAAGQPKPSLKQNQYGGTLGGPLIKDKIFFFGSYQGTKQVNGLDPSSLSTLILPPLTNDRSRATLGSQFCPANKPAATQALYQTFAGGTQVACDGSNINPAALSALQYKLADGTFLIPTPQTILSTGPNAGRGFSSYSAPSIYKENQFLLNFDYVISKNHTLATRFYYGRTKTFRSYGSTMFAIAQSVPGTPQDSNGADYVTSARLSSVLTSNLVNEAKFAFTRSGTVNSDPDYPPASTFGMVPVDPLFPKPPEVTIQGALGSFRFGNGQNTAASATNGYFIYDNLSWVHGSHTLRFGGVFKTEFSTLRDTAPAQGKITIQSFNDFLLGLNAAQNGSPRGLSNIQSITAFEGSGEQGQVVYRNRTNYLGGFLQDDLKVTPRLTINLGVRWEYIAPANNDRGAVWPTLLQQVPIPPAGGTYAGYTVPANYNPDRINPFTGQAFGPLPAGVLKHDTNTSYNDSTPVNSFAPRFGFAWQPGGKQSRISIRGGYGWFYQPSSAQGTAPGLPASSVPPFAQLFANAGASNNLSTLQQPFPTTTLGFRLRTVSTQLTDRVVGPSYEVSKIQQWNMNVQIGFLKDFTLDLGYVGSTGSDLLVGHGLNQPRLASVTNPVNCGLPNTAAGLGVSQATFATLGINSSGCVTTNTSANAAYRVPIIGETPTALVASDFLGTSWYHSLQTTLRKRVSHGLTFQLAYTYSKAENNTTVMNDLTDLSLNWARASFDRTHRAIMNFNYQVPSIRSSGLSEKLLGGWNLSGIVILQSGLPITLTDRAAGSVYGFASTSTVTLCPGSTIYDLPTSGNAEARLSRWVNTAAICSPPAIGSDGSTGYGNIGQSVMNGPGQFNTDFSIGKTTTVGGLRENAQLGFRVEFYNALNHPQFSNPGATFGTSNFGVITQTSVAPRLIQFGLKYVF